MSQDHDDYDDTEDPFESVEEVNDLDLDSEDELPHNPVAPEVPFEPGLEQSYFEDHYLHLEPPGAPINYNLVPEQIIMPGQATAREQELITNIEFGLAELKAYVDKNDVSGAAQRSVTNTLRDLDASLEELHKSNIKKIAREETPAGKKQLQDAWVNTKTKFVYDIKEQQEKFEKPHQLQMSPRLELMPR